jgi:universal stress protein A
VNAKKIVYPTDFSEFGQHALEMATALARDSGATLVVCHVEETPLAYGGGELYVPAEPVDRQALERKLSEVRPLDAAVPCVHKLLIGDPADAIVQLADAEHADFIVMGTHGRTGLSRLLMGSVAEAVVRRANCPVLTVKQPAHTAGQK